MGRVNISIPEDLEPLVTKWRRKINLSEICTNALRHELLAAESHRSAARLVSRIQKIKTQLEQELEERFNLTEAIVVERDSHDDRDLREMLGKKTAEFLNRNMPSGALLGIAGGRQSWCVVENMEPRPLEITVVALGYRQNDPHVLHAHANTLATILWLMFSPNAHARLIGSDLEDLFDTALPLAPRPTYFVVGSCSSFSPDSPLGRLLGSTACSTLAEMGTSCDCLYNFFDRDGEPIPVSLPGDQSVISTSHLSALSRRSDARIVLVAGGRDKLRPIRTSLEARLCNVLVTDSGTARSLLNLRTKGSSETSRRAHA